jgi:hypothetical protein
LFEGEQPVQLREEAGGTAVEAADGRAHRTAPAKPSMTGCSSDCFSFRLA